MTKGPNPEPLLMFMIAFDPTNKSASFTGTMSVEQAANIVNQAIDDAKKEEMRKEILAELDEAK